MTHIREVVVADFEFAATPGERPVPLCLVAHELRSGRRFRVWQDKFDKAPPYATGADVLFVAYYASAELGCYRALGWPMPERVLDLFTEFRDRTNGLTTPAGSGLLGALTYFGLDSVGATAKKEMQEAIGTGTWQGKYTRDEILDYCESDVLALERLLTAMWPKIDLPRALLRGRYMAAASAMEHNGVPIDVETLELFRRQWTDIQDELIAEIDADYGVYDGRTFKVDRFARWLATNRIPWPLLESGNLAHWTTAHSVKWRAPIRLCRRCGSCAAHYPTYGLMTSQSVRTDEIARSCRHFGRVLAATSQAIPSLYSAPVFGCAG